MSGPISPVHFLRTLERRTRARVSMISPSLLAVDEFGAEYFLKIRETLLDLMLLRTALMGKRPKDETTAFLSLIRCLNTFVYAIDRESEIGDLLTESTTTREISAHILPVFRDCLPYFDGSKVTEPELQHWMSDHERFGQRESEEQRRILTCTAPADNYFLWLFERCSEEYIDTGFYA